jgi:hypothetical protein
MSAQLPVKPRQSAGEAQLPPSGPLSRMATSSAQQFAGKQNAGEQRASMLRNTKNDT